MGACRGLEEALFPTLISTDFFRIFQNFIPGTLRRESKTFEWPFTRVPKIRFPLPHSHSPRGSPKSPTISLKNFQYFLAPPISTPYIWHLYIRGTNIRCTSKHRPGHKTARECTANSAVNPAANSVVNPVMDSTVHLR